MLFESNIEHIGKKTTQMLMAHCFQKNQVLSKIYICASVVTQNKKLVKYV